MSEPITPEQIARWRAAVDGTVRDWLELYCSLDPPTMRRILDALEAGERYRAALERLVYVVTQYGDVQGHGYRAWVDADDIARARAALAGTEPAP